MNIVTVGINYAENIFYLHCADQGGNAVLIKSGSLRSTTENSRPPAAVPDPPRGLAARVSAWKRCSSAHYWARKFSRFGHTVKLMALNFVAPYRMSGKNDAADAAAICEAVTRSNMRFVPVKDVDQQAILCRHRTRQGFVEERS